MKRLVQFMLLTLVSLFVLSGSGTSSRGTQSSPTSANRGGAGKAAVPAVKSSPSSDEAKGLEIRRQQLIEKEAALKAKEQELNALAAKLDARINELNAAQKGIEKSLMAKKKEDGERYRKILKIYRGLKPEEAAKLLNKLDEAMVIEMLNQMDQKTAIKLIPYINQPNVLKWTRQNLAGN